MDYDDTKIDEAALALLSLTVHTEHGVTRAWKSLDWGVTDRLFRNGLIEDPRNAAKSVVLTHQGLLDARRAAERLFARRTDASRE
jgi:Domain of unknown function (DUF6429)